MEYGDYKKHSAGARNVRARAKLALLLPSFNILTAGNVLKCLFGKSKGLKSKIDPGWVKNVIVDRGGLASRATGLGPEGPHSAKVPMGPFCAGRKILQMVNFG